MNSNIYLIYIEVLNFEVLSPLLNNQRLGMYNYQLLEELDLGM